MKPVVRRSIHSAARVVALGGAAVAVLVGAPSLTWSADLAPNHRARIPLDRTPVTAASLVCAGPELVGLAGSKDVRGNGAVIVAAPPLGTATTTGASVRIGRESLPALEAGTVLRTDLGGDGLVTSSGTEAAAPGLVAAQWWALSTGDFRGMVSSACDRPSSDLWLLGGGAEPGRQERVVLANPGANEVVVDLEVHGAGGVVDSQTGKGVVVPARGRTEVLLDAIAPGEVTPAVHVTVTGGSVSALLNDSWLDGTVPVGSASTGPVPAPARSQVVPMVWVPRTGGGSARLRVAVPGDQSAVVQVRALTPAGPKPLPGGVLNVPAGSTGEVALNAFAGQYVAVEATADVPIAASVRTLVRQAARPGDHAWVTAGQPVTGLSGVTLPDDETVNSSLGLVASGAPAKVEVVTVRTDGTSTTTPVDLAADRLVRVRLDKTQAVWVRTVSGRGVVRATTLSGAMAPSGPLFTSTAVLPAPIDAPTRRIVPLP
jgi:hypothetical protein